MTRFAKSLPLTRKRGPLAHLHKRVDRYIERAIRPAIFRRSVRYISGPQTVRYEKNEVLAFSTVRNGALHVRSFLEHHFDLGVCHVVLLDNGSTDDTVAIARQFGNVTILQTSLPYRKYENVMKRYLARRFCRGRWALCVDIDERFDYPFSDGVSLHGLTSYLDNHNYTAVVGQMLDMFPDATLADLHTFVPKDDMRETYPYYDISNIQKLEYIWGNLSNAAVKRYHGGIRDTLFGTNNGLSKASLFFVDDSIDLFVNWHHMGGAHVADFTTVLLHYPFVPSFREKVSEAVRTRHYGHHSPQYERYWQGFRQIPDEPIKQKNAKKLSSIEELLDAGFLVASSSFLRWARENSSCRIQESDASSV